MHFVSVTGPKNDIDRVTEKYLSKYEIHLEYAPSELNTIDTLHPYVEQNPYTEMLNGAEEIKSLITKLRLEHKPFSEEDVYSLDLNSAKSTLIDISSFMNSKSEEINKLQGQINQYQEVLDKISPFRELNYDIEDILHFQFLKYRFGRIPVEYWQKLQTYVYENLESVFTKCSEDSQYVWGVYFVPDSEKEMVDAAYTSLHFERTYIPGEVHGRLIQACAEIQEPINKLNDQITAIRANMDLYLEEHIQEFLMSTEKIKQAARIFDIRKYAACTKESGLVYYIICGWMATEDAAKFSSELEQNELDVICIVNSTHENSNSTPPTKLTNPRLFKPFEMFIKMYGLPAYNEFDPTIFVAITYAFIFGAMFGDVGQGLFLAIGGFILYKIKKMPLAAIVSCAGVFSTIFGFMFGSVFGFEDIIDAVWLRPVNNMTNLPFIGKLNTVFVIAIAFGMGLILITMILHIINGFRSKDVEAALFDTNGIAGFVFYGAIVLVVVLFMTGNTLPGGIVMVVMFGLPLLAIALKEPLTNLIKKKSKLIEGGKGMFITQTFFELFEVLLSYFSNTLSFVRIGAFAVSHAAMMEVVLMLAGAENGGTGNIVVIILGNLFVCGMEGLIVGIQVLRLEYYELFSRFYKGTGREFKPYTEIHKNKNI